MDALTLLRRSGWAPGRKVDVADELVFMVAEGFRATAAAEGFLSEYSGLQISWETKSNPLILSGRVAARGVDSGWCDAYSEALGVTLSPVGQYSNMTLYIDPSGRLWGGFDDLYDGVGSLLDVIRETFLEPGRPLSRTIGAD